ncbi:Dor1-domain-containing protein [Auriculariales sp. MPI-PUGE-AT-0066]|nr:Dor1-domain-containing protein [Auriculariales sp. MPI-PUGE-AT-0066]
MDDEYLARLASLPLQQIRDEPAALSAAASQLTASLTALCNAQYPTFLLAHGSSSTLKSTLTALDDSLNALIGSLQPLSDQCTTFAATTQPILADRRNATLLLDHHDKLLDLLELPQLLTTCIVNSSYQEALDLIAHARSLAQRFPDVVVVQDVRAEVEHAARVMAAQLLAVLREPAKLPVLFRAVNFLRRMGELAEDELALAFLTSRLALFDTSASALRDKESAAKSAVEQTGEDDARILRKFADMFRESAYDVVSQFTTIFLERATDNVHADLHHLLSAFVQILVQRLVAAVRSTLVPLDPARLPQPGTVSTLLTHISYTATSLARLGLDFRALLEEPVRQSLLLRTQHTMDNTVAEFSRALSKVAASAVPPTPTPAPADAPLHIPPQSLTAFPPLATLANANINLLNALRLLAPTAMTLQDELLELLASGLLRCARLLAAQTESPWMQAARKQFAKVLVPFIERGLLEGIFGVPPAANLTIEPQPDSTAETATGGAQVNGTATSATPSKPQNGALAPGSAGELYQMLDEWEPRTNGAS